MEKLQDSGGIMSMESRDEFAPFGVVVHALRTACSEGHSGTLVIFTDKAHGAYITFIQGRIIDIRYRATRGIQALRMIRDIERGRYLFRNASKSSMNSAQSRSSSLPTNDEIFSTISAGTRPGEILVVEDSAISRKAIRLALAGGNHEIVEAKDGFEALSRLDEIRPDLVLLDLILPKMDGYAVLAAMKKNDRYKNIPVIVLTSRDTLLDKLKGKMSGTDEYLTKPFQPGELLKKVEKHLNG